MAAVEREAARATRRQKKAAGKNKHCRGGRIIVQRGYKETPEKRQERLVAGNRARVFTPAPHKSKSGRQGSNRFCWYPVDRDTRSIRVSEGHHFTIDELPGRPGNILSYLSNFHQADFSNKAQEVASIEAARLAAKLL